MLILIILASLFPGILAVIQYLENEKKESESQKREIDLNSKIDSLAANNLELKGEIKILSKDNVKLSHQLSETAMKLNDNVIGNGDVDVTIIYNRFNEFSFRFVNNSDLPLNNANIMVQDYCAIMKCPVLDQDENKVMIQYDCYKDHFIKYNTVSLNPHGAINYPDKKYPFTKDYMNFAVQVETRRKTLIYHLVYKIVQGKLIESYRIYNLVNNKKNLISESNLLNLTEDYWSKNFYAKVLYTIE